jgi:hypothetical protein
MLVDEFSLNLKINKCIIGCISLVNLANYSDSRKFSSFLTEFTVIDKNFQQNFASSNHTQIRFDKLNLVFAQPR